MAESLYRPRSEIIPSGRSNIIGSGWSAEICKISKDRVIKHPHRCSPDDSPYTKTFNDLILNEAKLYTRLGPHPDIIAYHGLLTNPQTGAAITLAYAPKGNLASYIAARSSPPLIPSPSFRTAWIRSLVETFHYIHHHRKILHLDIKLENILVDANLHLRVCDFANGILLPADTNMEDLGEEEGVLAWVDISALGAVMNAIAGWRVSEFGGYGWDGREIPRIGMDGMFGRLVRKCAEDGYRSMAALYEDVVTCRGGL